jgi:hypothetical protein
MNIDKYKKDLQSLIDQGNRLLNSMILSEYTEEKKKEFDKKHPGLAKELPNFKEKYQHWYSEGLVLLEQLLPSRVDDFISYYKKDRPRKDISFENYTVSDYLQGLMITSGWEKTKIVGPDAALPKFKQQVAIIESLESRFESSLFDIRTLNQASLFENELEAAIEINKKGFLRAAGAIAGVVLEGHLQAICDQHKVSIKKNPGIADLNDALKDASVIDIPVWRNIQYLSDIRNLCDHKKITEPKLEDIESLISGVGKIIKTVF